MLMEHRKALADLLNVTLDEVEKPATDTSRMFAHDEDIYLVLDEQEIEVYTKNRLFGGLYTQRTEYLRKYAEDVPFGILVDIQSYGNEANMTIKRILGDKFDVYCTDVLNYFNGDRTKIFSTCDDTEHRSNGFFIYRIQ